MRVSLLSITPNLLTLLRVIASPLIVVLGQFAPQGHGVLILLVYAVAALSDFADGYLARKLNAFSTVGKCFDIIADKILISAVTIIALYAKVMYPVIAIAVLFREFLICGLREYSSSHDIQIPASRTGKWKTGTQMTAFTFFLFLAWKTDIYLLASHVPFFQENVNIQEFSLFFTYAANILIVISLLLSYWSATSYAKVFFRKASSSKAV